MLKVILIKYNTDLPKTPPHLSTFSVECTQSGKQYIQSKYHCQGEGKADEITFVIGTEKHNNRSLD